MLRRPWQSRQAQAQVQVPERVQVQVQVQLVRGPAELWLVE